MYKKILLLSKRHFLLNCPDTETGRDTLGEKSGEPYLPVFTITMHQHSQLYKWDLALPYVQASALCLDLTERGSKSAPCYNLMQMYVGLLQL